MQEIRSRGESPEWWAALQHRHPPAHDRFGPRATWLPLSAGTNDAVPQTPERGHFVVASSLSIMPVQQTDDYSDGFSGRFWPTMRPLLHAGRRARMTCKFGVSMTDPPIRHALLQRRTGVDRDSLSQNAARHPTSATSPIGLILCPETNVCSDRRDYLTAGKIQNSPMSGCGRLPPADICLGEVLRRYSLSISFRISRGW